MSKMMQDTSLLAIMVLGAIIMLVLLESGVFDLLVIWVLIFVGILFAYRALEIFESNRSE